MNEYERIDENELRKLQSIDDNEFTIREGEL